MLLLDGLVLPKWKEVDITEYNKFISSLRSHSVQLITACNPAMQFVFDDDVKKPRGLGVFDVAVAKIEWTTHQGQYFLRT